MIKIFPTSQIKQFDAYTIEHEPIDSVDLMERAALALTEAIVNRFPDTETAFVVFAGPGNNGGDALAVARLLAGRGYRSRVYLFNPKDVLSPDCETNRDRLQAVDGVELHEVVNRFEPPRLTAETVVIDGLFGSGLSRPLTGGYAAMVKYINASPATVVAIDVPSGLMGEDNSFNVADTIVRASLTLSLQLPKLAFLFAENESYVGEWQLLDIGLNKQIMEETETDYALLEVPDVATLLKPRKRFSHKGTFGRAMLIAGSQGMAGASVLAARACLRSGVGLLTVHLPFCNNLIVQTSVPEAMTEIDYHDTCFTETADVDGYQAVAIGPGLGKAEETEKALLQQIDETNVPMVIDADALNLLARHNDYLYRLPKGSILTPHPKELERLIGGCKNSFERLKCVRDLARDASLYIVLKGAYSAIVAPDGKVTFNTTGNPGMATGGSGDVLTGILLALLAQGYNSEEAVQIGVCVHGLAGDLAANEQGQIGMTSGDLITYLPRAWQALQ